MAKAAATTTPPATAAGDAPEGKRQLFFFYAALAGLFGALSGASGKLSVDENVSLGIAWRVASFALNGVFTGQMWRYYLKSLALGPTAIAQMVNTGVNFAASAVVGIALFGETINAVWVGGAALTCIGLMLIAQEGKAPT